MKFISALIGICLIIGCGIVEKIETKRITSPDNKVDAVVIRSNAGATTSYAYSIFILPIGCKVARKDEPVFFADHIENLNVVWTEPKLLEITYYEARIFKFSNFWNDRRVDNFDYNVKIRETEQRR